MSSINRTILIGRLTRDPELRKTSNGTPVASFTIAVDTLGKDGVALFFPVSIFGNSADPTVKYTHKGSLVAVDGRLSQRKYNRKADNVEITITEVIADNVQFLDPKPAEAPAAEAEPEAQPIPAAPAPKPAARPAPAPAKGTASPSPSIIDDDLPF